MVTMIHDSFSPAVAAIPEHHSITGHSSHHAQSDCGHYGSSQLKHSRSLLRNFSLRSRNSLSLLQNRVHSPPPSRPDNVRYHSAAMESRSSYPNSPSSVWKKWRLKSATHRNPNSAEVTGELGAIHIHHDRPMSCPQGSARKKSLFFTSAVSRLVAPFQSPSSSSSSSSDDSPCAIIPQSQSISPIQQESNLDAIQDEHNNDDSNPSCLEDADGIVKLIRQIGGHVDEGVEQTLKAESELKPTDPDTVHPLPSPPLLTPSSYSPSSHPPPIPPKSPPLLTPSLPSSPPLPPLPLSTPSLLTPPSSPPSSPTPLPLPPSSLPSPPLPPIPNSRPPSPSSSPFPIITSTPESNPLNPILKRSISEKRRTKFTFGDESDLDYDSLAVSATVTAAEVDNTASNSNVVVPGVLLNDSVKTTVVQRPSLMRHERFVRESRDQDVTISTSAPETNGKSMRRWTLSSALTDEGISDEGLVKELERIRNLEWNRPPTDMDEHDPSSFLPSPPPTPFNPWLVTQRALLATRELILTERHYLSSLSLLLCPGSTLTPVPEMMLSYVKELVSVSERLLRGMEREPSVRGVAEIFVEIGGGLGMDGAESALVAWCGVVGEWFQGDSADTHVIDVKRKRKRFASSVGSGEEHPGHESSGPGLGVPSSTATGEHAHTSPLMRNVTTWRKSMPSIAGLGESGVWRRDRDRDRDKDESDSTDERGRMSPTFDASMKSTNINKPMRKPAVRDLAILPTQRVMRYVLLYRDLLANTPPSSSSYPTVERAVETACRIAEKCDRAQGNAAFVTGGASTHDPHSACSSNGSSTFSIMNNKNNNSRSSSSSSSSSRRFNGKRVMTLPEPSLILKSGCGSTTAQSSSPTSSPTKSHFFLSSSPVSTTSPTTSSALPRLSLSLSTSSKPIPSIPASPTKKNCSGPATKPLPAPPPPSSFTSKIPIARSGRSFGSLSTTSTGSSTTTTTTQSSTFSSPPSSSSSASSLWPSPTSCSTSLSTSPPTLCLPKSTTAPVSSRIPKPLSPT